jgi:hypothetical protein
MNIKRDYKWGDMLKLADTRIVQFVERGGVEGRLIVADRNGRKDIIKEEEVVDIIRPEQKKAYARK